MTTRFILEQAYGEELLNAIQEHDLEGVRWEPYAEDPKKIQFLLTDWSLSIRTSGILYWLRDGPESSLVSAEYVPEDQTEIVDHMLGESGVPFFSRKRDGNVVEFPAGHTDGTFVQFQRLRERK